MIKKIITLLLSLSFLYGCTSQPSEEDGWVLDEEEFKDSGKIFTRETYYTSEEKVTQDWIKNHEGTWRSNKYDDVGIMIKDGKVFFNLHLKNIALPVEEYTLKKYEHVMEYNDYAESNPLYTLHITPPEHYELAYKLSTIHVSGVLNKDTTKYRSDYLLMSVKDKEMDYPVFYELESDSYRDFDDITSNNSSNNKTGASEKKIENDIDLEPQLHLNTGLIVSDDEGLFKITGRFTEIDLNQVNWYIDGEDFGNAASKINSNEFYVPVMFKEPTTTNRKNLRVRAVDTETGEEYLNQDVLLDTTEVMIQNAPESEQKIEQEKNQNQSTDTLDEATSDSQNAINILLEYYSGKATVEYSEYTSAFHIIPTTTKFDQLLTSELYTDSEPSDEWKKIRQTLSEASVRVASETEMDDTHLYLVDPIHLDPLISVIDGEIVFDKTE